MTKSNLFKAAHTIAKQIKAENAHFTYRECFSIALKEAYTMTENTKKTVEEKLLDCGCTVWEKYGYKRIYINDNAREVLDMLGYKRGAASKWYIDGDCNTMISSGAMDDICGRAFYDCAAQKWDFSKCWKVSGYAEIWEAAF